MLMVDVQKLRIQPTTNNGNIKDRLTAHEAVLES